MLLIPYKAELEHLRIPIFTILIMLICVIILIMQNSSATNTARIVSDFCEINSDNAFRLKLKKLTGRQDQDACEGLLYMRLFDPEAETKFENMLLEAERVSGFSYEDSRNYLRTAFEDKFDEFDSLQVSDTTGEMAYYPNRPNIFDMFTATLAHSDWSHLIGNLFFFFAFAVSVEILIGSGRFLMLYACLAIGTALTYSLFTMTDPEPLPTIGLSGVVMGMIGVFAYLMPTVRIKCFFWFLVFIRVFSIPAWILALWFIGWDLYGQMTMSEFSNINFIAHLSGAFIGFFFGLFFLRKIKRELAPS